MLNYGGWQMMPQDALRPARVASVLQMILGAILLLAPTCGGAVFMVARAQAPAEFQSQLNNMQLPPGITVDDALRVLLGIATTSAAIGLILLVLAFFVRRASRTGSMISISLTGIVAVVMVLMSLNALRELISRPAGPALFMLIILGGGLSLCSAMIAKLVLIVRSGQDLHALAMQQSQYWAMMQQQGAYGFGYPPPPPDGARPVGAPPATPGGPQNPPPPQSTE
jgi:hypothetical protein